MGYYNSGRGQFQVDSAQEQVVGKFLDKYFYNNDLFSNKQRIIDSTTQKGGTDIIVTSPFLSLTNARIDEKCALSYINCDIPTFSFELSSKKMGEDDKPLVPFCRKEGWLLNSNLSTEYYMLTWLLAQPVYKEKHFDWLEESNIISALFVLISKTAVIEMLAGKGFDSQKLREIDGRIRMESINSGVDSCIRIADSFSDFDNKVKFSFTTTRAEEPINVLLYRSEMIANSVAFGVISRGLTTVVCRKDNKYYKKKYEHPLSV